MDERRSQRRTLPQHAAALGVRRKHLQARVCGAESAHGHEPRRQAHDARTVSEAEAPVDAAAALAAAADTAAAAADDELATQLVHQEQRG